MPEAEFGRSAKIGQPAANGRSVGRRMLPVVAVSCLAVLVSVAWERWGRSAVVAHLRAPRAPALIPPFVTTTTAEPAEPEGPWDVVVIISPSKK